MLYTCFFGTFHRLIGHSVLIRSTSVGLISTKGELFFLFLLHFVYIYMLCVYTCKMEWFQINISFYYTLFSSCIMTQTWHYLYCQYTLISIIIQKENNSVLPTFDMVFEIQLCFITYLQGFPITHFFVIFTAKRPDTHSYLYMKPGFL